jgi:outer membrane protein
MIFTSKTFFTATCLLFFSTAVWSNSLSDIYQSALKNDPVLKSAQATYSANKETLRQGRAVLMPQLSAAATVNKPSASSSTTNSDKKMYSLNLRQALFNMPAWFQFQSAKQLDKGAQADFAAHQQDLIIRVSQAYLNILRAHSNDQTRKAEELAIQRQLEQTKERFEVGLIPITDVHEIQAIFDEATVNRLEATGALDIAFEQLQVLTGQRYNKLAGLSLDFVAINPEPLDASAWAEFALANNLKLKSSQYAKQASDATAKAAKSAHLPQVSLSVDYQKNDFDNPLNETNSVAEQTALNVNFTMPIYSGGLVSSQYRQAKYKAIGATENYKATKRSTVQSTRSTYQLVVTNSARVKARKQAIKSAESALKATQAGYEVGTRNIVDVLMAQRTLYRAKRNYANARYDYIISMMQLKAIAGQLSPEDLFELDSWLSSDIVISR